MTATATVTSASSATPSPTGSTSEGMPTQAETPMPTPTVPSSSSSGTSSTGTQTFGTTWEWPDGLKVTVSQPSSFNPSSYAAGIEGFTKFVQFDVTVENGTQKKYEPSAMYLSVQSGGGEAEQVFDTNHGMNGTPSTVLLPGRSVSFKVAFGVKDPADLVMEVTPTFDYDPAIFVSG